MSMVVDGEKGKCCAALAATSSDGATLKATGKHRDP
jgi:hypothetical protein